MTDPIAVHQQIVQAVRTRRWSEALHWIRTMNELLREGVTLPPEITTEPHRYSERLATITLRATRRLKGCSTQRGRR